MNVETINRQPIPLRIDRLQRLAERFAEWLEDRSGPDRWSEVALLLVDDAGIAEYNRDYFGKDRPTDVISFRYDPVPGEEPAFSGDLIVNVERALRTGPEHDGPDRELALYVAHGFDHLSGAEDDTPERRAAMLERETGWLRRAEAEKLLSPGALFG